MKKDIFFAGGCFWGTEHIFKIIPGVLDTTVGYANGSMENPSYEDVCYKATGHRETVKVTYDDAKQLLSRLVQDFFMVIDPTVKNRQGNDMGSQYQTGVYYVDEEDLSVLENAFAKEKAKHNEFYVELKPLNNFYDAEWYHQDYLDKNPDGYCHISYEEMEKVRKMFATEIEDNEYKQTETDDQLFCRIGAQAFDVVKKAGTERPYSGQYNDFFEKGLYVDIVSGEPLFTSNDKFNSGCGWPAFSKPISEDHVNYKRDNTLGMNRVEVRSKGANSHLGHVFQDGPEELGGMRYCINSAALRFIPFDKLDEEGYGEFKKLIN